MKKLFLGFILVVFFLPNTYAELLYNPETTNLAYAYCVNSAGEVVPNCDVTLSNGYYFSTAQHNHTNASRPVSTLMPTAGNTGSVGLPVLISTTQVGQVEGVFVCADLCSVTIVYVGYFDFADLASGSNYVLIGATTIHPNNHWGTSATLTGIQNVASTYHSEYPANAVIAINDIGLPIGGIFDLNENWVGPHDSHGPGRAVDVRGNGRTNSVPRIPAVQSRFREICKLKGATLALHEAVGTTNEHFHCQWP
jgi:hypothetical protein